IRARGEHLTELDECWTQLFEHQAKAARGRLPHRSRRCRWCRRRRGPGRGLGQLRIRRSAQELVVPVFPEDSGDVAEATEILRRFPKHTSFVSPTLLDFANTLALDDSVRAMGKPYRHAIAHLDNGLTIVTIAM